MKGLGEVAAISVAPNAVYHATGERVRDLPITVEKIFLKGAMAGRRAVAVFRGLSLGIGSGIHRPHAHISIPVPEQWTGRPDVMTQPPEAASRAEA